MTREELIKKQKQYIYPSIATYFSQPLVLERGEMQFVWDSEGKKYLDFFGGIVTVGVGHANPRVTARMKAQIDTLQHVSTCFITEPAVTLAEKLAQLTPGKRLTKSFFYLKRHGSERDRGSERTYAHRQPGDHRAAARLQRAVFSSPRADRHEHMASRHGRGRHRARCQSVLLSLSAQADVSEL
jgi:hypothetical protein